ncbi:MAG: response regulator [Spirochaetaceae bacterium]|jgi:signal transduction histidine kinase|nr:response regulator [Spirochaetaceae bacterium]
MGSQVESQEVFTEIILANCPSIIIILDDEMKLRLCSRTFVKAVGASSADELRGKTWEEIFNRHLNNYTISFLHKKLPEIMKNHGSLSFNRWFSFKRTPKRGENRYYTVSCHGIDAKQGGAAGIQAGLIAVFVDNTAIMEEKQQAEKANQAKSNFLAAMSHEIRTPMNAILGLGQVLEHNEIDTVQRKYIEDIRDSASSLLSIVNDVLDFSKIEAGKMTVLNIPFKPKSLLESIGNYISGLCATKNLAFSLQIDDNFPDKALGDENRLRQLLTNLLSNAYKYTEKGKIALEARLLNKNMEFSVRDTGVGIKKEDIAKLFVPFEQLDMLKNRKVHGTGLGLSISDNLCKLMGGSIRVESEYGKGSVFTASIPWQQTDVQIVEHDDSEYLFSLAGKKALVADDIDINLEVCEAMFGGFNLAMDRAISGKEALEKAEDSIKTGNHYDIIFLDQMMPGMDGFKTCSHLRRLGSYLNTVPIIALTANTVDIEAFSNRGFQGFLAKPMNYKELGLCLRQWVK